MSWIQALIAILEVAKESGGVKKFAEWLTRNREEVLRMQKELPVPGHSKGY